MMEKIQETVFKDHGIYLHMIPTKKFKTMLIVAKLQAPLKRDTVTKRALLMYLLQQGTMRHPSVIALQKALNKLYGASLSVDVAKKGPNHIFSIRMEVANEKFIRHESELLKDALQLFKDILSSPIVQDGAFDQQMFAREKETLRQKIQSIRDDKMAYANMRLIDEMCQGEAYQLRVHGYEEDLDALTPENVYTYYKSLLTKDRLDLFVVGDMSIDVVQQNIYDIFGEEGYLTNSEQDNVVLINETPNIKQVREVVAYEEIEQAKLHIGYRTHTTFSDPLYFALQVFNGLYGGFPTSKLFKNVREKHSLAYYASSRIESHQGLLFVFSGIDGEKYEKTVSIVDEQMEAMKRGDFTEQELTETKELIIHGMKETLDNPNGIAELFYQQIIGQRTHPPDKMIELIEQVTYQDVVHVAKRMEKDTIFLLTKKGANHS